MQTLPVQRPSSIVPRPALSGFAQPTAPGTEEALAFLGRAFDASSGSLRLDLAPAGAAADALLSLSTEHWETAASKRPRSAGAGPCQARLNAAVGGGSEALSRGLRILGIVEVECTAPPDAQTVRFFDRPSTGSREAPWQPRLTVISPEGGCDLRDIFVNQGAEVVGCGLEGKGVLVHYLDDQGNAVRSLPLEDSPYGSWDRQAAVRALHAEMSGAMRGRVLDLSAWSGGRTAEVRSLDPAEQLRWLVEGGHDNLDLVVVGPHQQGAAPLIPGTRQLCTADIGEPLRDETGDPFSETSSMRAERAACENFLIAAQESPVACDPEILLARLLDSIVESEDPGSPKTLDLTECDPGGAQLLQSLSPKAWDAFLAHPRAAAPLAVVLSPALRPELLPRNVRRLAADD